MNDDPRYEMSGERLGPRVSEPAERGEREGAWYRALPAPEPSFLERALSYINHPLNQWAGGPGKFVHAAAEAGGALGALGALGGMLKGEKGLRSAEDLKSLLEAKRLANEGRAAETWEQTGWERGPSGEWAGHIAGPNPALDRSQLLKKWDITKSYDDPGLYEAYPHLKTLSLRTMTNPKDLATGAEAQYFPTKHVVELNPDVVHNPAISDSYLKSILGHELQHAIQQNTRTPRGASPSQFLDPTHSTRQLLHENTYFPILEQIFRRDPELKQTRASDITDLYRLHTGAKYYTDPFFTPEREQYLRELQQRFEGAHPQFRPEFEKAAKLYREPIDAFNKYYTTTGEAQARVAGKRVSEMTEKERRQTAPSEMEDVPRTQQWSRY